jgi:hypothetical protein
VTKKSKAFTGDQLLSLRVGPLLIFGFIPSTSCGGVSLVV